MGKVGEGDFQFLYSMFLSSRYRKDERSLGYISESDDILVHISVYNPRHICPMSSDTILVN